MNNISRTFLGILLAVITLLVVIWIMPVYQIRPRAIFLPADGVKTPYTGYVKLYYTGNEPFLAKKIGVINLRYHANNFGEQNANIVYSTMQRMAANGGGNGLIIDEQNTRLTYPPQSSLQVILARATVIQIGDAP